jgi:hypothetical protein
MAFLLGAVAVLQSHSLELRNDCADEIEEHTELERAGDRVGRERAEIRAEYFRVLNVDRFAWCNEGMQRIEGNKANHPGNRAGRVRWPNTARSGHMDVTMTDGIAFETAVSQEETRLRQLHPTTEDIPSCMNVFDDFLSCNSMLPFLYFLLGLFTQFGASSGNAAQINIPLWRDGALFAKMERVQVLFEHQGITPRATARRVD